MDAVLTSGLIEKMKFCIQFVEKESGERMTGMTGMGMD